MRAEEENGLTQEAAKFNERDSEKRMNDADFNNPAFKMAGHVMT